jgi:Tfp pilus assembly protein PilV
MRPNRKAEPTAPSDHGFTIIELLLTVVILIVGIVSVAQLVPVSTESNLHNRDDSVSLIAAQSLLEQMINNCEGAAGGCNPLAPAALTCNNPPPLTICPAAEWNFCDTAIGPTGAVGYCIPMGQSNLATNTTTSEGCALNALGQIDFTVACGSIFTVVETPAGQTSSQQGAPQVELRWRVITERTATGSPYRKVYIVAARTSQEDIGGTKITHHNVIANLVSVVGKQ